MSAAMTINLDVELLEKLEFKSHQIHLDPENTVLQLIRSFVDGKLLLPQQDFAAGISVSEYLSLTEDQEDSLWSDWSNEAEQQVGHLIAEVDPDALSS